MNYDNNPVASLRMWVITFILSVLTWIAILVWLCS